MKRLHLLRHAKSSWDDPELVDHDRPLAPRGERASLRIAEHIRREGIAPELVLCSTALRTRQTLAALLPVLEGDVQIRLEDGLYGAGVDQIVARLRDVDEAVGSVLMVGHNPTLHALALALTRRDDTLERFPTGALASMTVGVPWSELDEGVAGLESFVVPRELGD